MRTILVCFTLVAISIPALSQEKQGIIERDQKGIICSVEFSEKDNLAPQSAEDFFSSYLGINRQDNFEKTSSKSKRADFIHEHYDQYYKGVKVEGGGYNFHYRDNKMYFANGHYVNVESIVATPSVTSNDAIKDFLLYKGIDESEVTNVINELFIKEVQEKGSGDLAIKLVYRLYLESDNINNNEVGFVDAHMGGVITTEPRTTDVTGTFATRYSGSRQAETAIDPINGGYRLYDNTRGTVIHTRSLQNNTTNLSSAVELNDNNNNWTAAEHATSKNDMGLDVHWTLQKLYDYLYATHGINSFDDAGRSINAYVRYGINHDNAHWDPTLKVLYFGQGSTIFNPLASFDAVAHEFGHGITDFQIGWSGSDINKRAFHEGMSDIWGAILEQRIRPNSTWKIGEQITKTKPHLRNLQNTNDSNSFQKIADTYGSAQYDNGQTTDEYVKSGVFSHWFYVLVNGESGINDINNTYSVNGIGLDKAEKLIVEAVFNNYLDNTAFYPEVRTSMINAAKALFCDNSAEVKAVTDAWYAVGVGPAYSGSAIMDVAASSLVCSGGSVTLNNVPSGTAVTWQGSGSLLSPSSGSFTASGASQSIPLTAISPTSGGSASFTVTLNNLPGCSVPAKIEKNFWFGLPSANISAVYNSSNNWVTFNPASPSTGATYSWVIDGVTYPYGNAIHPLSACGGSPYITTYTFEATLTAVNSCGTSTRCQQFKFTCVPSKTFTSLGICGAVDPPPCDPSIVAYEVSPNPANSQINVVIVPPCESITADNSANGRISSPDEDESKSPEDVGTQSVVLYDLQGQKRYSEVFTNKKNFNIDVSSLSQGIYILRISTDKQIEQRRIVISK